MKKILTGASLALVLPLGLMLYFAPDGFSLLFILFMAIAIGLGCIFGILPALRFMSGFETAQRNIEQSDGIQATSAWLVVQGIDSLFNQKTLDGLFGEYRDKVNKQEAEGSLYSDIVEFINEDILALHCWQNVIQQLPGTITALGLLGTFVGLIIGITGIGFSSVEAALGSIETLLSGIGTAFYSSIAGVALSILFNLLYRLTWNAMLRQMGMFIEQFHRKVLPSAEEQLRNQNVQNTKLILEKLERLPKTDLFSISSVSTDSHADSIGEMRLMPAIREGLQNGEFTFYVQPRYDLNNKNIVGCEALMRWNHGDIGQVQAADFLPIVERNGFIVRLDKYVWENVCKTLRRWIDSGNRPIPIAVNVTKTDILSIDITEFFEKMIFEYQIPPRYLEIEIAENAFSECPEETGFAVNKLRQNGFHIIVDGVRGELGELSLLKTIQVDSLKLDIRGIHTPCSHPGQALREIMDKVNFLRMPIKAIGIETAEQLSVLRSCGCAEGQGYFLCKAISLEEFEDMTGFNK